MRHSNDRKPPEFLPDDPLHDRISRSIDARGRFIKDQGAGISAISDCACDAEELSLAMEELLVWVDLGIEAACVVDDGLGGRRDFVPKDIEATLDIEDWPARIHKVRGLATSIGSVSRT
ncbi:hypothetical protein LTS08_006287 [Lithohypha guttulata]|uniref:uncharacterized protein n=1 Tax=Lithohypha guttulata TaxID=1690604 RepID=UPI002DDEDDE5|nr:hypothetical protein LTR51_002717 [Lithohypha guttulata]KAK5098908.1 hypothetical protein LTS08_006287 [Lithohypha guttulata]